ncbi:cold-shock protein [Paenibacillus sp. MBLB4367]|uniref:cold-shock protein n=1 Tax=Paenibacillus sp. MBLB4367 TaxID=3384767 RepID=UPI0039082074
MYYRKKSTEIVPEESTAVWLCSNDGCNMWMRDNFSFKQIPNCPQCHTPMVSGTKMLPNIVNSNDNMKQPKIRT